MCAVNINTITFLQIFYSSFSYCSTVGNSYSRFSPNTATSEDMFGTGDTSPFFDLDNSGNVTAVLGKTAYLNCRVKNIKNQTVSAFLSLWHLASS